MVFTLYGADKFFAIKGKRRISEKSLLISAFVLGGVGAFVGMHFFHHKTKHTIFNIFVPISFLLTVGAMIYFVNFGS